jgi:hypothetical protein
MIKLTEIPLDDEGVAYVDSCLRQGTGLCSKVREISFSGGRAFAPLPEGVSAERARKFKVGGLTSRSETQLWLVEHVRNLHQRTAIGRLIFQDIWAKPTDPAVRNSGLKAFFEGANVYYELDPKAANIYSLNQILRTMESYLFIAMYTDNSSPTGEQSASDFVDELMIEKLARDTIEIFVGAYDQEGLVVWCRD